MHLQQTKSHEEIVQRMVPGRTACRRSVMVQLQNVGSCLGALGGRCRAFVMIARFEEIIREIDDGSLDRRIQKVEAIVLPVRIGR